jgi:hypothetical protein
MKNTEIHCPTTRRNTEVGEAFSPVRCKIGPPRPLWCGTGWCSVGGEKQKEGGKHNGGSERERATKKITGSLFLSKIIHRTSSTDTVVKPGEPFALQAVGTSN